MASDSNLNWELNWQSFAALDRPTGSTDSSAIPSALGGRLILAWRRRRLLQKIQYLGDNVLISGRLQVFNQGLLQIAENCQLSAEYQTLRLAVGRKARLFIGAGTIINSAIIAAQREIRIGENCRLGPFVHFMDSDFHDVNDRLQEGKAASIQVGNNVRLGAHTLVLRGVTIGDNAEVLPGAVVTKDIPADALAGGVPARVIKISE